MAKPMTMSIAVEEAAFGRVFRLLDSMPGVVSINILGTGPKANGAAPAASQKRGGSQSVPCLALGMLMESEEPLNRAALSEVLIKHGKKPSSLPDALMKMRKAKEIRTVGKGRNVTYKITPAGIKRFQTACQIETEN